MLQSGFSRLFDWTSKWLLMLSIIKCGIMTVGRGGSPLCYRYVVNDNTDSTELQRCEKVKDLRIIIDSKLSFDKRITDEIFTQKLIHDMVPIKDYDFTQNAS